MAGRAHLLSEARIVESAPDDRSDEDPYALTLKGGRLSHKVDLCERERSSAAIGRDLRAIARTTRSIEDGSSAAFPPLQAGNQIWLVFDRHKLFEYCQIGWRVLGKNTVDHIQVRDQRLGRAGEAHA